MNNDKNSQHVEPKEISSEIIRHSLSGEIQSLPDLKFEIEKEDELGFLTRRKLENQLAIAVYKQRQLLIEATLAIQSKAIAAQKEIDFRNIAVTAKTAIDELELKYFEHLQVTGILLQRKLWDTAIQFAQHASSELRRIKEMNLLPEIEEPLYTGLVKQWNEHFARIINGLESMVKQLGENETTKEKKK